MSFSPAVSRKAAKEIVSAVRQWKIHKMSDKSLEDLSRMFGSVIRGWVNYYGRFYRSKLSALLARSNAYLVRWIRNKYRRLDRTRTAHAKLAELAAGQPRLFRHWAWVTSAWR